MIPQRINNLLSTGKNMATSHIAAAAYRTQPIEWSAGAAAGTTAIFSLEHNVWPYQLIETLPDVNPRLTSLQERLQANGNPISFQKSSPEKPNPWWWPFEKFLERFRNL
jgi:hypothetical protein